MSQKGIPQMIPGLYKADFATPLGSGAGVIHIQDGKIRGGDSVMMYVGDYVAANGNFTATINVDRHTVDPNVISVFGIDKLSIHLAGKYDNAGNATCFGTSPQAPGVNFNANLQRIAA